MPQLVEIKKRRKKIFDKKLLFYCCLIALPLLQFAVFYIYVNFNSLVLAFTAVDGDGATKFVWFDNFKDVLYEFFKGEQAYNFLLRLRNSLINYGFTLVIGTGGAILFSYYIYKKRLCSGFFKVILFLPHIIPAIALLSMYRYFMEAGVVNILRNLGFNVSSFLNNKSTVYGTVLFISLFMSFGTQVLMYLGAMNNINPSITEAAKLDGASFMRELWSITVPCIYSTIVTFCIVGLTAIFVGDMGLYNFFAANAPGETQTLGYYLFRLTQQNTTNTTRWPFIAAVGLLFTCVVAPVTLVLKNFLDKKDPIHAIAKVKHEKH